MMKQNQKIKNGISIKVISREADRKNSRWQRAGEGMLAITMYLGLAGSFCSMFGCGEGFYALPAGILLIAAGNFSSRKKSVIGIFLVLLMGMILTVVGFSAVCSGMAIVWSRVAEEIEAALPYVMGRLPYSADLPEETGVFCFCLLMFLFLASVALFLVRVRGWFLNLLVFLLVTVPQILLEISPAFLWNLLFYGSFVLMYALYGKRKDVTCGFGRYKIMAVTGVFFCILAVLLSGISNMIWPADQYNGNEMVDESAQMIRKEVDQWWLRTFYSDTYSDIIDAEMDQPDHTDQPETDFSEPQIQFPSVSELPQELLSALKGAAGSGEDLSKENGHTTAVFRLLHYLGFFILAALIAFIVWIGGKIQRRRQVWKHFDDAQVKEAICWMYADLMDYLTAFGLRPGNVLLEEYAGQIREMLSASAADGYMNILRLRQEARYSNHEMDEQARSCMRTYLDHTKDQVNERCNVWERIKLSVCYYNLKPVYRSYEKEEENRR